VDIFKRPIFFALFAVAVVITLIWSSVSKRHEQKAAEDSTPAVAQTAQITNLTNIDPTDFDTILKDELDLANAKALEANSQYRLAAVEVELPSDLKPSTGTDRYVYISSSDHSNNWLITISQQNSNFVRALIPKGDYLGELQEINQKFWKFNYLTALQIAEKNGGLTWRESNKLQSVKLTLHHTPPKNWLVWDVEYKGDGNSTFKKVIDANSGQVVEEDTGSTQESTSE